MKIRASLIAHDVGTVFGVPLLIAEASRRLQLKNRFRSSVALVVEPASESIFALLVRVRVVFHLLQNRVVPFFSFRPLLA